MELLFCNFQVSGIQARLPCSCALRNIGPKAIADGSSSPASVQAKSFTASIRESHNSLAPESSLLLARPGHRHQDTRSQLADCLIHIECHLSMPRGTRCPSTLEPLPLINSSNQCPTTPWQAGSRRRQSRAQPPPELTTPAPSAIIPTRHTVYSMASIPANSICLSLTSMEYRLWIDKVAQSGLGNTNEHQDNVHTGLEAAIEAIKLKHRCWLQSTASMASTSVTSLNKRKFFGVR